MLTEYLPSLKLASGLAATWVRADLSASSWLKINCQIDESATLRVGALGERCMLMDFVMLQLKHANAAFATCTTEHADPG
jgi:hypothetical protein